MESNVLEFLIEDQTEIVVDVRFTTEGIRLNFAQEGMLSSTE